jgi:hypothetical protein
MFERRRDFKGNDKKWAADPGKFCDPREWEHYRKGYNIVILFMAKTVRINNYWPYAGLI